MELDCRTPTEHVQRGSAKIMSFPMSSTHLMFCRQSHPAEERFLHDATPQRVHITVLRGFVCLLFVVPGHTCLVHFGPQHIVLVKFQPDSLPQKGEERFFVEVM